MSVDASFRCPVCRATQTVRDACRRCQADLRLVVHARRRLAYVLAQREQARACGDRDREQALEAELRWLSPTAR